MIAVVTCRVVPKFRIPVGPHQNLDATIVLHSHALQSPVVRGGRGDRGGPREVPSLVYPDHERPVVVVVGTGYLHGQVAERHSPVVDGVGRYLAGDRQFAIGLVDAHPGESVVVHAGLRRDLPVRIAGTGYVGVLGPPGAAVSVQ